MTLTDRHTGYGWLSIAFHWIAAALVVILYLSGEELEELSRGAERTDVLAEHSSIGAIAVIVLGVRILWRIGQRGPKPVDQAPALNLLSHLVQWGLLAALAVLILSGPVIQWSVGRSVDVFGLVSIPSMLPEMRWLHEALEEVHEFASHALIPLLALHVLGALKHLVIDRDDVFRRMLWGRKEAAEPALEGEPGEAD